MSATETAEIDINLEKRAELDRTKITAGWAET